MALAGEGIWVRLTMMDGSQVRGYATGAESPNDFWAKFRTQMVRLEEAQRLGVDDPDTATTIYVNRASIALAEVIGQAR